MPQIALAVLLVNDHILKSAGLLPGWLTGKLSDLAGLFFFPLFLCALLALAFGGWRLVRPQSAPRLHKSHVALASAITGLGFAALQLSPDTAEAVRIATELVLGWLPSKSASVTMDATDLLALPMLLVSYWHGTRFVSTADRG